MQLSDDDGDWTGDHLLSPRPNFHTAVGPPISQLFSRGASSTSHNRVDSHRSKRNLTPTSRFSRACKHTDRTTLKVVACSGPSDLCATLRERSSERRNSFGKWEGKANALQALDVAIPEPEGRRVARGALFDARVEVRTAQW